MNKSELRKKYKEIRNSASQSERIESNRNISLNFLNSLFFHKFNIFLCYISIGSEVDTVDLIKVLLSNNKKVAVPYCNECRMDFYFINSLDELAVGAYGIPTVDPKTAIKVSDFSDALCIVPALSLDLNGNRLGYGGGYYDRFLAENRIDTVGLCIEKCIADELPSEEFDIKIKSILTENGFRYIKEDTYE